MLHHKMTIVISISVFLFCMIVTGQDTPEESVPAEEAQVQDKNLEESPDEAIGDRIMEEMNGMKVFNNSIQQILTYNFYLLHCKGKV